MSREDIERERDIHKGRLYDYIGSTELGMHVYRLTQTAEALRVDAANGYRHEQEEAEEIHRDIAERTRADAHLAHGQYPEDLPVAKDINLLRSKRQKFIEQTQAGKAASGKQLELGLN